MNGRNTSPLLPYNRHILSNQATVLVKERRTLPLVAVDLWVGTGSSHELPDENGISHFLEHLFFKGTPARPVGVMDRQIKSLGGYNNAATSYDYTHYYVVLPSEHAELGVEILLDALLDMELPPEEIERERSVVLEEIARKEDSPFGKLYDDFLSTVFIGTPYEKTILGTPESLAGIDRDRFMDYRNRRYGADNIHVVVTGDVESSRMVDCVAGLLGEHKPNITVEAPSSDTSGITGPRLFEVTKDVQQTYLCMGMLTPSILGTADEIALDLVAAVLGEGRSSRLQYRLVESSGICSSAAAFAWTLDRIGLFGFEACYDQEDEPTVMEILEEEIEQIRSQSVPEEEFERAKTQMKTSYFFSAEKVSSLAGLLGRNSLADQLDNVARYIERVEAITPEFAQESFNRCCPADLLVKGFVRPEAAR